MYLGCRILHSSTLFLDLVLEVDSCLSVGSCLTVNECALFSQDQETHSDTSSTNGGGGLHSAIKNVQHEDPKL